MEEEPTIFGRGTKSCFISEEYKLCFINIPKNASTTIRTTLKLEHCQYSDNYKDYKKIIVIRDPITRIVAGYNEILKLRRDGAFAETQRTNFYKYFKVRHDIPKSFDLFLDYIKNNLYDDHLIQQSFFLKYKGLSIDDIDYVIDFKNLNEELQKIIDLYNIKCPKIIRRQVGSTNVKRALKPILGKYQKKIRAIYSKDFELYNKVLNNN